MLQLREISHGLPGVLGFLMARQDGPPTLVRRPPLDCYLLGIGLNISNIRIDANGRTLRRGTYGLHGIHLVQPNQDADYFFSGKLVNFRLRLSVDAVAAALDQMGRPSAGIELTDIMEQSDTVIGDLCRRLLRESVGAHPDKLRIDSLMQLLVNRIMVMNTSRPQASERQESLSPAALRRVIDYIEQSPVQDLSLLALCEVAGLSRAHFLRAFKNAVGAPPHAFVTMSRLRKAGEMLHNPKLRFSDIATIAGFSSHSHMTAAFRTWIVFTPSELREPNRHGCAENIELLTP
jgi:AraC-like DNA-binding protein